MEFITVNGKPVQVPIEIETDSREAVQKFYDDQTRASASTKSAPAPTPVPAAAPAPSPSGPKGQE